MRTAAHPCPSASRSRPPRAMSCIPGRLSADIEAKAVGSIPVSVNIIAIDDKTWITNPFTANGSVCPAPACATSPTPKRWCRSLVAAVRRPAYRRRQHHRRRADREDRRQHRRRSASRRARHRPCRQSSAGRGLARRRGLPARRIRIVGPLSSADNAEDVSRQIDLSRYDQPVEINPP